MRPVRPDALVELLADRIASIDGIVRIGVDGPPSSAPGDLADALVQPLRTRSRAAVRVRAEDFWRDASVRLEYGHEDADAYLDWLDAGALRREVLDAAPDGAYLPTLRDRGTNRATRAQPQPLPDDAIILVSGTFLLGLGLPFELVVHLALSPGARARRTPEAERWTLPAFDRYDAEVAPTDLADVIVRWDDPQRPAVDFNRG